VSVVSVINYKGGVGKTTLTANIGAELANRGRTVLLIDLDPQSSLTFSFSRIDQWERELAEDRTVLSWLTGFVRGRTVGPLYKYVVTPRAVNQVVQRTGAAAGSTGRSAGARRCLRVHGPQPETAGARRRRGVDRRP
jgi:chromosome partitioning protein